MSAIEYAMRRIRTIQPRVIVKGYSQYQADYVIPLSLEELVIKNTIQARVIQDCHVEGGQMISLHTNKASQINAVDRGMLVQFSTDVLGGNDIVAALEFTPGMGEQYGTSGYGCGPSGSQCNTGGSGSNLMESIANQLQNTPSLSDIPMTQTKLKVVGKNTIFIDNIYAGTQGYLRVIVGHDQDMMDLQPRLYNDFSGLCMSAVESHIYTNAYLDTIDGTQVDGFVTSGLSGIIQGYEGSEDTYQERLGEWYKLALMNDAGRNNRIISLQSGLI